MSTDGFVEIGLVHTHIYLANKRLPDHTISSYRDVFTSQNGSFFYEDGDSQVTISRVEPDTKDQKAYYEQHVRLPVSQELVAELATETVRKELSAATDSFINDVMTRRFDPKIFTHYLTENGWKDSGVGHDHGLHVFQHIDHPPRQIVYAHYNDRQPEQVISEDIHDAIRKLANITARPELGIRLDLIRQANSA